MKKWHYNSAAALLPLLAPSAASDENDQCRLYLAESTIPGAGLGIFTGVNLPSHTPVAEPDIVIPLADYEWHTAMAQDFHLLWGEYSWQTNEVSMETDMVSGSALVIGTGCMPNCNFALINAHEGKPEYGHAGLTRKDYGVTGFTGFHNQRMVTDRSIPAGGEIFVNYGEAWFTTRGEDMATVPFEDNFDLVDEFLVKFKNISLKYQTSENPDFTKDLWSIVEAEARVIPSRSGSALPLTFEDMQSAQSVGAAESRLPYSMRTVEWLNENGRCMDNIRPGNSTIRDAGRGAFASRFIPKGGLVAPGPVLHIPNKAAMNMYETDPLTGNRDTTKESGKQLILNYCFGHGKSTLLLCPYTSPSAYINHSRKPNARVVWADDTTKNHNADWLQEGVEFLKQQEAIGLSLNFVATRDIRPGEEVFIDYGREWEKAWKKYVKEWKPPIDSDDFAPAATLQKSVLQQDDLLIPLRTISEQEDEPYPQNLVFYCHTVTFGTAEDMANEGLYLWGDDEWEYEWSEWNDWSGWEFDANNSARWTPKFPCKIIHRSEEASFDDDGNNIGHRYSAILLTEDEVEENMWAEIIIPQNEQHMIHDIPRAAISVRDKMYSKNEFLYGSFRHAMMIPDDIFPKAWINL
mmetsp:Transcript_13649/g.27752  ORF Transcript_13649/g.27752 Transcript_13649/m.27752 type:complete len:633 (+) Transcript_13649:74-1972(+)